MEAVGSVFHKWHDCNMTKSILDDAAYWRKRARETMAKAASTRKPEIREKLLRVANEYEEIALRAEQRADPPGQ
jgi:hypothetical protein